MEIRKKRREESKDGWSSRISEEEKEGETSPSFYYFHFDRERGIIAMKNRKRQQKNGKSRLAFNLIRVIIRIAKDFSS